MKSCTKPYTVSSDNAKMSGSSKAGKGYKDGGYVMKPEDYVDEEAKRAAAEKARNEQIKADAEAMKKMYPEKKGK
jgi:hypothetical protein